MKFSEYFKAARKTSDDWFDPFLSIDTKLFVDPFLLYATESGPFVGSHSEVIAFFNTIFQMIAKSGGKTNSLHWRSAANLALFPEVQELCLGYTGQGTAGSGSGKQLSEVIVEALWDAVKAGVKEITHFEEVRILREGIGADRISDITASIIRARLAAYTGQICQKHKVPTSATNYIRGQFNPTTNRWDPSTFHLPVNPYSQKPILLVPRNYLRSLPSIDPDDFWQYCYDNENETLRDEYSADITRHVDKKTIIAFARRHPEFRMGYLQHLETNPPSPYDFETDPRGLYQWYDTALAFCASHPLAISVSKPSDLVAAVKDMIDQFSRFVRDNKGWKLLWNDNGKAKSEEASQLLFLGTVIHYCRANDLDVSPETNIGRGPVDFKVSRGYSLRAHIEVKLAKNSKFWNGLQKQLPTYMKAEDVKIGHFLVVQQTDADSMRLKDIASRIRAVRDATGYDLSYTVIDARYGGPPSASKL